MSTTRANFKAKLILRRAVGASVEFKARAFQVAMRSRAVAPGSAALGRWWGGAGGGRRGVAGAGGSTWSGVVPCYPRVGGGVGVVAESAKACRAASGSTPAARIGSSCHDGLAVLVAES